jgi:hypothetical protein
MNGFKDRVIKFDSELRDLCEKYNIFLWDCGCCGLRFVDFLDEKVKQKFGMARATLEEAIDDSLPFVDKEVEVKDEN